MMGWVECIIDDSVHLLEYKEKGNVSASSNNIKVSFILIPADILIHWFVFQCNEFHPNWLKLMAVPFFHTPILKDDNFLCKADSVPWIGTQVIITKHGSPLKGYAAIVKDVQDTASGRLSKVWTWTSWTQVWSRPDSKCLGSGPLHVWTRPK